MIKSLLFAIFVAAVITAFLVGGVAVSVLLMAWMASIFGPIGPFVLVLFIFVLLIVLVTMGES